MKTEKSSQRTVHLVGGAVRDELLGRTVQERDWVVTGASRESLLAEGFRQVGKDFPVFISPVNGDQHALARTERKVGRGHTGFICHFGPDVTLEEDLKRRDLTVNSMAKSADGELIDPFGGQADLKARVLRHVSDAFAEDPLRVLRVARFAAQLSPWGFTVADETEQLLSQMAVSGELASLTGERVWQETKKALASPDPNRYFSLLENWNALGVILGPDKPKKWLATWGATSLSQQTDLPKNALWVYALLFAGLYGDRRKERLLDIRKRLKVPNRYHEMALKTGALIAIGEKIDAAGLAQAFAEADLYRQSDRLYRALEVACQLAETAGWQWSYALIKKCAKAVLRVSAEQLVHLGLSGMDMKRELTARRKAAIERTIKRADEEQPG